MNPDYPRPHGAPLRSSEKICGAVQRWHSLLLPSVLHELASQIPADVQLLMKHQEWRKEQQHNENDTLMRNLPILTHFPCLYKNVQGHRSKSFNQEYSMGSFIYLFFTFSIKAYK